MHIQKYIEMLDHEIDMLIQKESKGLSEKGEMMLGVLFKNRKYAKKLMEGGTGTDNPSKSYFGGM